jgi:hypothetical protein
VYDPQPACNCPVDHVEKISRQYNKVLCVWQSCHRISQSLIIDRNSEFLHQEVNLMDQYKMPMVMGNKSIYLIRCSFCKNVLIPDGYSCRFGFRPQDNCNAFEKVDDVTRRVEELFALLPDGAGSDIGESDAGA